MNLFLLAQIHHYDEYDMDYEFDNWWNAQFESLNTGAWQRKILEDPKKYLFVHSFFPRNDMYRFFPRKIRFFEKPKNNEKYLKEIVKNVPMRLLQEDF